MVEPRRTQAPYVAFLHKILILRQQPRRAGDLAAIRAALIPATEAQAFPYTEYALHEMHGQPKIAARRVAGMIATHKNAQQFRPKPTAEGTPTVGPRSRPLGVSLRHLHRANFGKQAGADGTRNALTMQVDALPMLPLEEAVQSISLLVGRCADKNIAVDFIRIAHTLAGWGNGIDPKTRATRAKVVEDFYGANDA